MTTSPLRYWTERTSLRACRVVPVVGVLLLASLAQGASSTRLGPDGGAVVAIAVHPSIPTIVYAGVSSYVSGAVYKTTNGGASWTATALPAVDAVGALAIDPSAPQTVYAATGWGILKTTNGGSSWQNPAVGNSLPNIRALAIDPSAPNTLYAAASYGPGAGGVYKTTDGGVTWLAMNSGLTDLYARRLVLDPTSPSTLYVGTGDGVFKTTDGAATWAHASAGIEGTAVWGMALDRSSPSNLYVATNYGVFKTVDGAASWSGPTGPFGGTVNAVAFEPSAPGTAYATGLLGVYKTTNGGTDWSPANVGYEDGSGYAFALDPSTPGTMYLGSEGGVYKTTSGGTSWTRSNSGINRADVRSLTFDPSNPTTIYAGTYANGIAKTVDLGTTWTYVNSGLHQLDGRLVNDFTAIVVDPSSPSTIYAGAFDFDGAFKTTDGGASWTKLPGLSFVRALAIDPANPNKLYAGGAGGAVKTSDGGSTWTAIDDLSGVTVVAWEIEPNLSSAAFAGTSGGVFKTTDGGASWSSSSNGLPNSPVLALARDASSPGTLYVSTEAGTFRTTDAAATWTGAPYPSAYSLAIDPATPGRAYAGRTEVLQTNDGAGSWSTISPPNPGGLLRALVLDPTNPARLFAGSESGVLLVTPACGDALIDFDEDCDSGAATNGTLGSCCSAACAFKPSGTACADDGNLCTADACDGANWCAHEVAISTGCFRTGVKSSSILLRANGVAKQNALTWTWVKGEQVAVGDFGLPTQTTSYSVCIYDDTGGPGTPTLRLRADAPAGSSWRSAGTRGFSYKSKTLTPNGIKSLSLLAGVPGKSTVRLTGKGVFLPVEQPPYAPGVTVQLKASNGMCWEASYGAPTTNAGGQFKAKSD